MKICLILTIMSLSYIIGNNYKKKVKVELEFLIYLKNFAEFLNSNINLFKNDLVEIIDEYLILENKKNAKYDDIFQKNGEIYSISNKNIEKYISSNQISLTIFTFLNQLGKNEYEFESNKILTFIDYLNGKINEYSENLKKNADLFFKVSLSIGAVISILVW